MNNLLNLENNILIPSNCPVCNNFLKINGVNLICDNYDCSEQQIQKIVFWCKDLMDDFSEKTIRFLYNEGVIKSIVHLYELLDDKNNILEFLEGLPGLGKKKIKNLFEQINKAKKLSEVEFLKRLGIPTVGLKALKKLGIETIDQFLQFEDNTYKIGEEIIKWKRDQRNLDILFKLLKKVNLIKLEEKKEFSGNKICMTGTGPYNRSQLIMMLEEKGDIFVKGVTKKTNILICENINGNSSKLQKARKYGIKLMSYEEYFK